MKLKNLKKVGLLIMAVALSASLAGCTSTKEMKIDAELYPAIAPVTVANFVKLVDEHFYDGLIFQRVIPGFMIQGGGIDTSGNQKSADSITGEFTSNGFENDLTFTTGVLGMARTPDPNSASSQFFIMVADYPSLNGDYAAFGKVTNGMDACNDIVNVPRDSNDKPLKNQVIKTINDLGTDPNTGYINIEIVVDVTQ